LLRPLLPPGVHMAAFHLLRQPYLVPSLSLSDITACLIPEFTQQFWNYRTVP